MSYTVTHFEKHGLLFMKKNTDILYQKAWSNRKGMIMPT